MNGYTTVSYKYNPELDPAYKAFQNVMAQYAPGGKIQKAMTTAQESALQQGKRKAISNIAQQLVSAGLAGTTALPSAELGYEAEVMAPARAQLEAQLAQQYADAQLRLAQYLGSRGSEAAQMQYGNIQGALQRAAQYGGGGTRIPFMGSSVRDGTTFGESFGISPTTAISSGGWATPAQAIGTTGTQTVTSGKPLTGSLLSKTLWESEYGRLAQPGPIESALRYSPEYGVGVGIAPGATAPYYGISGLAQSYSLLNEPFVQGKPVSKAGSFVSGGSFGGGYGYGI